MKVSRALIIVAVLAVIVSATAWAGVPEKVLDSRGRVIGLEVSRADAAVGALALAPADPASTAMSFLSTHGPLLGIRNARWQLRKRSVRTDELGQTHVVYAQVYAGVPVEGGTVMVHLGKDAKVRRVTSKFIPGVSVPLRPRLPQAQAEEAAVAVYTLHGGVYDTPRTSELLVYLGADGNVKPQLAWKVTFVPACLNPLAPDIIYIGMNGDVVGTDTTIRTLTRRVVDCSTGWCMVSRDPADCVGDWCPGREEGDPPVGLNPFYGGYDVDEVYDMLPSVHNFWLDVYGRNGANYVGGLSSDGSISYLTRAYTYYDYAGFAPCPNAYYGGSGSIYFCQDSIAFDVVAHEYAHGVTKNSIYGGGTTGQGEPGALEESFCDMSGERFEYHMNGACDWKTNIKRGGPVTRNYADPASVTYTTGDRISPYPDRFYSENFYCGTEIDNGGVHINGTVPSKAFYLLSEGGTFNGCTITGIGIEKAHRILYRALTTYYTYSITFNEAAVAWVNAAQDLYGATEPDIPVQVRKAVQAVEMDQPGLCSGIPWIPPAADERPVVGINGRDIRDSTARGASNRYRFRVWGKAAPVDEHSFTVDDGSGPLTVVSPGHPEIASGDIVLVTGNLDAASPTARLHARPENVIVVVQASPLTALAYPLSLSVTSYTRLFQP